MQKKKKTATVELAN